MARLEGEKKSLAPYIVGLLVLAALAAGAYALLGNKGNTPETDNTGAPPPIAHSANHAANSNASTANGATSNGAADSNSASDNGAADSGTPLPTASDTNSAANSNSASGNTAAGGAAMMGNSATGNAASSNAASSDASSGNAASGNSAAGMGSHTSTDTAMPSGTPQVVAERSKTIKTGKATVTYDKKLSQNGGAVHSQTTTNTASE